MDRRLLAVLAPLALLAPALHANAGWPSLGIFLGYFEFWYIVIASLIVEYIVVRISVVDSWGKALGVTLAGNGMSFLIGGGIAVFIGPFLPYFGGGKTELLFSVVWTLLLCWAIETLAVMGVFKFKFGKIAGPMAVANVLTHSFYVVLVLR
ncbi:hypothetical protein OAU50_04690 [Planctomycetota bacterium]|nr:hypothetical protein [Planctomycetota bacterium]